MTRASAVDTADRANAVPPHRIDLIPRRLRRGEDRVFAIAMVIGLVHAVDDAVFGRQPGVAATQHLPALVVVALAATVAIEVFPLLRDGLRSGLALSSGALLGVNGTLHVLQGSARACRVERAHAVGRHWHGRKVLHVA